MFDPGSIWRNRRRLATSLVGASWLAAGMFTARAQAEAPGVLGWTTNGPAVFRLVQQVTTNAYPSPTVGGGESRQVGYRYSTNAVFDHYLPDSLNHLIWTNLIARTNGRTTQLWTERRHPPDWPTNPPVLRWNPRSLLYGWRGWTAISPCWEGELYTGQIPITALTPRHGYTRGHGMGPDGFSTNYVGRRVWFLTARNELITVKILRQVVRIGGTNAQTRRDYTIFLFDRDLPTGIEPVSVAEWNNLSARYSQAAGTPSPMLRTEQGGHVGVELPGFSVPAWKGGDSGSPDLVGLPDELVFVGGRSTTGPTPAMQADMDELCRREALAPGKYQLRWADLSRFPIYGGLPE